MGVGLMRAADELEEVAAEAWVEGLVTLPVVEVLAGWLNSQNKITAKIATPSTIRNTRRPRFFLVSGVSTGTIGPSATGIIVGIAFSLVIGSSSGDDGDLISIKHSSPF
jgi:hypothetical protein